ncbi:MAG TPA: glutathione S-transferase family protein [Rhodospirillaceae bacterium]|nr:glutathione S-transferase [Rhodospirillaceae bacterium]HAA93687.1 glutathione S-transferase family protein [Rhodospirillaceae bacterium]HAT35449.1 glutathione S-transferase family protein [Rhodospirillaceae bacterium]
MANDFMLVSFKTCPWVQRAAIVLREKGIEYDIEYIDRDNRPDWFLAISPHSKVPVLRVGGEHSLFESCAIAEYLDEATPPQLHPADLITKAQNRAWTDFLPDFASAISRAAYSDSEAILKERAQEIPKRFEKLEAALEKRGNDGPYFNGPDYSLADCGYAPFLQRYGYVENLYPLGILEDFPLLTQWRDALMARPSTASSTVENFEHEWQQNLIARGRWLGTLVKSAAAAE